MTDAFKFLKPTRNERISFIRISEETKYKHLYQYCITTESGDGYIGDSNQFQSTEPNLCECVVRQCQLLDKKVLTSGEWEVDGEKVRRNLFSLNVLSIYVKVYHPQIST